MFARAAGRFYLDMNLATSGQVRTRIIECPGMWMAPGVLAALVVDLRRVVRQSLPSESLNYGVLSGSKERLDSAVITILYDRVSGAPVAFNALSVMDIIWRGRPLQVLHLGLVMVDPGYRTQGLSWVLYGLTCMLLFVRKLMRPLWVSNVTQVPAIIGKVAESFAQVYPAPDPASRRRYDHLVIAREIMHKHRHVFGVGVDAGFDEQRFVITNAYTGGSDNLKKSFVEAQHHRDSKYNSMCEQQLNYDRGDDFLQIGQFNLGVAKNYLLRTVPRDSLPALLMSIGFLLLGALMLPALHWFSTEEAEGDLRPWKS